jgi:hypothetical protein
LEREQLFLVSQLQATLANNWLDGLGYKLNLLFHLRIEKELRHFFVTWCLLDFAIVRRGALGLAHVVPDWVGARLYRRFKADNRLDRKIFIICQNSLIIDVGHFRADRGPLRLHFLLHRHLPLLEPVELWLHGIASGRHELGCRLLGQISWLDGLLLLAQLWWWILISPLVYDAITIVSSRGRLLHACDRGLFQTLLSLLSFLVEKSGVCYFLK